MKVKELIQLLQGLNPEAELGIDEIYIGQNGPNRMECLKLVEQTYLPHSKSFTKQVNDSERAKDARPAYVFKRA